MALPVIRLCKECKRKFNDFTEKNADVCPGCLSKPTRRDEPIDEEAIEKKLKELEEKKSEPIIVEGENMKSCIDCGKPFMPRANVQKRCEACGKIHASNINKPLKQASVKLDPMAEQPNCVVNDAQVILNLLLATNKITQAQVEACKTLLITLR